MDSRFWFGCNSSETSCLMNCQEQKLAYAGCVVKRIIGCATGNNGIDKQIFSVVGNLTGFSVEKGRRNAGRVSSVSGGLLLELSEVIL